jgi:hypothetical protein
MIKPRTMKVAGHVACMVKMNAYRVLVGKPERPLGRPRCTWEDNVKMDVKEKQEGWCELD